MCLFASFPVYFCAQRGGARSLFLRDMGAGQGGGFSEPSPRWGHFSASLQLHMYFMQHWSKLEHPEGEPWPVRRSRHAAVCLDYGGDHPQLLVTGVVTRC